MENERTISLNRSQALIKLINANVCYVLSPRANGKTFSIGDRIEHLNDVMPRSQILLLSDTYKRLEDKIVPNICDYFINHAGMKEDEDFVVYKKPPEWFEKPLIPLQKFEHVVSFADGMALWLVSGQTEGSANAYNAQSEIVDEAKFVKQAHVKQASLVLRGSFELFGHLPEYRSKWFFTDKYPDPGSNIKWLLNEKPKCATEKVINSIASLQLLIIQKEQELTEDSVDNKAVKYIQHLQYLLNHVRKELMFYCEGIPFENIAHLGEKYYRDQKRDLSAFEYKIAILNQDPNIVENSFYPALNSDQHYYEQMNDINPDLPFAIALDYNWRITPMVVAQYGMLPGNTYATFNTVAGVHTLSNGGIQATCKAFADQFKMHRCKTVLYAFDSTAVGKSTAGDPFYKIVTDSLHKLGWSVQQKHIGPAPEHSIKFETIKIAMGKTGEGSFKFNKTRSNYLLLSMQQAGAIMSNGVTKKDKRAEKKDTIPPEECTDYSDAWDCLAWAQIQWKILSANTGTTGEGFSIR